METHIYKLRLLATRSTHTHGRLEGIVDPPLEASEGTNHDHTGTETLGGQAGDTDFASNLAETLAPVLSLAHEGDKLVSGVGDYGADDTGEVTGGEGDTELRRLAVCVLGLGEDVGVEELHDVLEEVEFSHGVRDL